MEKTKTVTVCEECGVEFGDLSMRIAGADKYVCVVCGKEYCREHIGGSLQGADSMDYDVTGLCPTHYEQAKRCILKSRQRWWDRTCNPQGGKI